MFANLGTVTLYVFGIKVLHMILRYEPSETEKLNFTLQIGKKKREIHINNDKEDKDSVSAMKVLPFFANILIRELRFEAVIGSKDALQTMLLMGSIKVLFYSLASAVKSRQPLNIYERFTPVYNANVAKVQFHGILHISIADIIYSYITNAFKKRKKNKTLEENNDYRTK